MAHDEYHCLYQFIEDTTGIRVNPSHKMYLDNWIESNLNQFKYSVEQYLDLVQRDESEAAALVDEAAINETYFFREELQFSYLQDMVFPKQSGKTMHIWSAASSTGEEALSLYILAKNCGVQAEVTASDIDRKALASLRQGEYGNHSFRRNENHFMSLLQDLGTYTDGPEKSLKVSEQVLSHVHAHSYNLITDSTLPVPEESVDVIFLRNVFIYFSAQNQLKVLQKISKALKPGGLLFLSINEIAAVECPDSLPLVKEHFQTVYYMRKVTPEEKAQATAARRRPVPQPVNPSLAFQKAAELLPVSTSEVPAVKATSARSLSAASATSVSSVASVTSAAPQVSVEELWNQVHQLIERREFADALYLVNTYHFKPTQLEYQNYYLGMIAIHDGRSFQAGEYFFRATAANPKFWPALFQRGMVCQKLQNMKGASESFQKCKSLLESSTSADNKKYEFLTEGFNSAYFLNLCESLLRN